MAHGDFVWCDLSARNLMAAREFYSGLFGWQYHSDVAPDGSEYLVAYSDNSVAGLFTMPKRFDQMGMPCFWMSYIEVRSVEEAIRVARDQGAKVEVGPVDGANGSVIALIRDQLGAGFTAIEGPGLVVRPEHPRHGEMAWNDLFVSDATAVMPFYQAMFGWEFTPTDGSGQTHDVTNNGVVCSTVHQLPEGVRGKEQFWGVHFAVDDLAIARTYVIESGSILYERDSAILARDGDNAAFFLTTLT
ncbi:MAG: VOC family protein [Pseudomonadota bacterium]